ncbi:eukaryotic translation elongation factor 1 epsilon-1-like [Choloepus didactylus]|uniref:eukaryotic translation elongation factor 1 epsilon-1-like n=1 Tax=Choloepus didactylus TaxID=27675 RepID=UPI00189DF6C4|nr:eukaryotic translation elongation factor 1 epsilon-1-like [Choloepus didactylus]
MGLCTLALEKAPVSKAELGPEDGSGGADAVEEAAGLSKGKKYSTQGEHQIPVLQTNNGPSLTGLTAVAAHLVKQANEEYLLGSTGEEKAMVQQTMVRLQVTQVDGHSSKHDIPTLLKDLNSYLADKVHLTCYYFTLADILPYHGHHRFIVDQTVQEKGKYLNVSCWFCHIQHYPGIRQHLSSVVFIKNRLYTNSH